MAIRLSYAPFLLVLAVCAHFVAVYAGLYDLQIKQGVVWFDNILHAIVGVSFGIFWLWVLRNAPVSTRFTVASLLFFVFVLACLWEAAEYVFFMVFDSYALGLKVYSPSWSEAAYDIASDMVGAVLLCALIARNKSY